MTAAGRALLLVALALSVFLTACSDQEGDTIAPDIVADGGNVYFLTSDATTLRVSVEAGAEIEVYVAEDLTLSEPVLEGSDGSMDTWSFDVSGLLPGSNSIAVTARDLIGNQKTLYMSVTYDFLALDQAVTPLEMGTTGTTIAGTMADGVLPIVTVTASDGLTDLGPVVTADATYSRRWIATFDLPANPDLYTIAIKRDDTTYDATLTEKSFALTVHDPAVSDYPLATIDPLPFEVVETAVDPSDPANRLDDSVILSGDCLDGATVSLLFNNQEQTADTTTNPGRWSSTVTLQPGKNFVTLTVTATDDTTATSLTTTAYDALWYLLP